MKVTRVGPDEIFHRYLTPRWASLPTSGAGAEIDGGRFNRSGVEALCLSRSTQTAPDEFKQGASVVPPATLAAYKITLAEVADLSQRFDPSVWDSAWREWDCAWRQIARIDRKIPSSWKLADLVITAGLRGILFPSLHHAGGTNLVIFPANLVDGDHVAVHDPDHRLPQDQSSWS
ncbi:RES domain-containing protein [Mesorhizobium tamadayense]|uniref:RES domain-containing protein n=1 Tax=Mesorhizobium tamadayense TaxID=425306 RepID=A0A3P3EU42_9HYPH|nr:RES domain-containing protein [Mesorhizobium tamadayense]RRH89352.1 RES domain-containing protein [Mesorhizobium tamadayense]